MEKRVPELVRVEAWEGLEGLRHGFTRRHGGASEAYGPGELNLGFTVEDKAERVRANRAAVVEALGGSPGLSLALVRQIHSGRVRRVKAGEKMLGDDGRALYEGDGLISDAAGMLLGVQAADCVPVLAVDARLRVAGAFHAGWRGTVVRIVEQGIRAMQAEFGSRPEEMMVAIGPSIGACCYAVGGELMGQFAGDLFEKRAGKMYLDLWEANRRQALAAGVLAERITVMGECTSCSDADGERRYFSHRAEVGRTGRGMGLVGWA